jgi:hypothetical protein
MVLMMARREAGPPKWRQTQVLHACKLNSRCSVGSWKTSLGSQEIQPKKRQNDSLNKNQFSLSYRVDEEEVFVDVMMMGRTKQASHRSM